MVRARLLVLAFAFATPLSLGAQSIAEPVAQPAVTAPEAVVAPAATIAGPRLESTAVAAHAQASTDARVMVVSPDGPHLGRSRAMMVVGGAGLIVGALVGGTPGTIIMIAGGAIGLVGLWEYLQ